MAKPSIDAVNVAKHLTLNVTLKRVREFKMRVWIGVQLIRLAARIMNVGLQLDKDSPDE